MNQICCKRKDMSEEMQNEIKHSNANLKINSTLYILHF